MRKVLLGLLIVFLLMLVGCAPIEAADVVIQLKPGVDTIEVNTTHIDAGATAKASWLSIDVTVVENTVDVTATGTYHIVYQCQYQDIVKQIERIVAVIDETPPVVSLNAGVDTVVQNGTWTDAGVTTADNGGLAVTVDVVGEVLTQYVGEYLIQYVVTDAAENVTIIIRYVNVVAAPNA
ncbi:MAG: immunoglobulin-like domain-containing protein [bacterium]